MATPAFDPTQFKAGQRREWGVSAPAWRQNWTLWEQAAQHVNVRLVELAGIQEGDRVLDIASGLGEPAFTAARRVGPTGWVVATDLSPEMLTLAQAEAIQRGIAQIEFREMDAESPDLPERSFQAMLCRWGLMFLPNLPTALIRLHHLLVPGGRFAAAVWGTAEKVPMTSLAMNVIRQTLDVPPPIPGTPGTFRLADPQVLTEEFTAAGFHDVTTEHHTVTLEYASPEHFIQEREAVSTTIRALLYRASPSQRVEIQGGVTEAISAYREADGVIRLPNETLCVVGRA